MCKYAHILAIWLHFDWFCLIGRSLRAQFFQHILCSFKVAPDGITQTATSGRYFLPGCEPWPCQRIYRRQGSCLVDTRTVNKIIMWNISYLFHLFSSSRYRCPVERLSSYRPIMYMCFACDVSFSPTAFTHVILKLQRIAGTKSFRLSRCAIFRCISQNINALKNNPFIFSFKPLQAPLPMSDVVFWLRIPESRLLWVVESLTRKNAWFPLAWFQKESRRSFSVARLLSFWIIGLHYQLGDFIRK